MEEAILATIVLCGVARVDTVSWFVYSKNGANYIAAWPVGWFAGYAMPSWYGQFMFEGCDA